MTAQDFHPDLRRTARIIPRTLVTRRSLGLMRTLYSLHGPGADKGVGIVRVGDTATVRVFRQATESDTGPALLWIHGGGYVMGNARNNDDLCRRFADRLGITVASVEYRLAPEHPYPAALEDCYAALEWLAAQTTVDRSRVAIGGASAGAGLAAALAFMVRDQGGLTPQLQLLSYPMLDDRAVPDPAVEHLYRGWSVRSNTFAWAAYLASANPDLAVPARRTDLAGLPPAWIGVGTNDLFYAEDVAYAKRLDAQGVRCDLKVVPGAFHGFDGLAAKSSVAQDFFDSQCRALTQALALCGPLLEG